MGLKSRCFPTKCMFIISWKIQNEVDKIKKHRVLIANDKYVCKKVDNEKYRKGTLIAKLWPTMYNYRLGTLSKNWLND